jgi:hypothetical protein
VEVLRGEYVPAAYRIFNRELIFRNLSNIEQPPVIPPL